MNQPDHESTADPGRRLRIVYLRNLYRPVDGGGNRYAVEVTNRLARRGHDVVVVTGRLGAPADPAWSRVRIVEYPRTHRHPLLTFATNAVSSRVVLGRTIGRSKPDVVIISSWDCGYGFFGARPPRVPTVYIYHSSFYSESVRALGGRRGLGRVQSLINSFLGHVESVVLGSASRIVAVSEFSRRQIEQRLGDRVGDRCQVVNTGVDTDLFCPGDRAAARQGLDLDDDVLVLIVVGRMTVVKRYDRAVRALALLRNAGRRAVLLVVGEGPEQRSLAELAGSLGVAEDVRIEGFIDGPALVDRLRAADVQLCTSEFENWSLAILEGLACGTPVLGTPYGGTPQLLAPIDPGLVLPGGSEEEIVAAIEALEARGDWDDLSVRCRTFALGFSWDSVVDELETTLFAAAASKPPPQSRETPAGGQR